MDSETRMWERLWVILAEDDWDQIVYVYGVDRSGRTVKPFLAKWAMHSDLLESIRHEFGAGVYHLMIRQGKTMRFTGTIGLGPRPGERPNADSSRTGDFRLRTVWLSGPR